MFSLSFAEQEAFISDIYYYYKQSTHYNFTNTYESILYTIIYYICNL